MAEYRLALALCGQSSRFEPSSIRGATMLLGIRRPERVFFGERLSVVNVRVV